MPSHAQIILGLFHQSYKGVVTEPRRGKELTMVKILAVATHATDDPTKATLAFLTALGAVGGGKEAAIALLGEGAYLAKEVVARNVHGVGFPPLAELVEKVVKAKVAVYV